MTGMRNALFAVMAIASAWVVIFPIIRHAIG